MLAELHSQALRLTRSTSQWSHTELFCLGALPAQTIHSVYYTSPVPIASWSSKWRVGPGSMAYLLRNHHLRRFARSSSLPGTSASCLLCSGGLDVKAQPRPSSTSTSARSDTTEELPERTTFVCVPGSDLSDSHTHDQRPTRSLDLVLRGSGRPLERPATLRCSRTGWVMSSAIMPSIATVA